MSKVNIKRLDSVTANDTTATALINENFLEIQKAIDNTLSRDGTVPNFMDADIDLNSRRIINGGDPVEKSDYVTLGFIEDSIGTAVESAAQAANSAAQAASSAQSALVSSSNATSAVRNAEETISQANKLLGQTQQYVDDAKVSIDNTVENGKAYIDEISKNATSTIDNTVAEGQQLINQYIDDAKVSIDNTVAEGQQLINQYVVNAEDEVRQIALDEASKAIANAAEEATTSATNNVNNYVDTTIKPALDSSVASASASATAAAKSAAASLTSANNAKTSETNAKQSETSSLSSKNAAASSATSASNYANNSKIWAEGTDAQVQALGGSKSAKGWAESMDVSSFAKVNANNTFTGSNSFNSKIIRKTNIDISQTTGEQEQSTQVATDNKNREIGAISYARTNTQISGRLRVINPNANNAWADIRINNTDEGKVYASVSCYKTLSTELDTGVNNTTTLANTKFVHDVVNEANTTQAAEFMTALNAKAPLASPAFTGTVTFPSPSAGDNSTKGATTAWVKTNTYRWGVPNYSAGVSVSSLPYTAPSSGVFLVSVAIIDSSVTGEVKVNGQLAASYRNTYGQSTSGGSIPPIIVNQGDLITVGNCTFRSGIFYPFKGV